MDLSGTDRLPRPGAARRRRVAPQALAPGIGVAFALATGLLIGPLSAQAEAQAESQLEAPEAAHREHAARSNDAPILHLRLDSAIQPVAAEFLAEAVELADRRDAQLLIVEINTPGGLGSSMHSITSAFLEADTPILVYVSPKGSQAASAGFFLLMASDIAAMAPGTNTGAAHPVTGAGQDIPGDMRKKVEEDFAANVRSLAQEKKRNVELAESTVIESRSFSANEALEQGLVEILADDLDDLLAQLDGRIVAKDGIEFTLATQGAIPETLEMTTFQVLRTYIADPNISMALIGIGGTAILIELYNPGLILPGMVGAICLLLGGYGLSILPVSGTGIALLVLAALLFALEVKVPSFGLLTVGGATCLVLGSIFLLRDADPALRVGLETTIGVAIVVAVIAVGLSTLALRARSARVTTGREGLVTEHGVARTAIDPRGKVAVHGEIWNAISTTPIAAGDEITVEAIDGLTLKIRPRNS